MAVSHMQWTICGGGMSMYDYDVWQCRIGEQLRKVMQVNAHGTHGGRPGCGLLSLAAKGLLFLRTIAFAEQRAASVWIVSTVSVVVFC